MSHYVLIIYTATNPCVKVLGPFKTRKDAHWEFDLCYGSKAARLGYKHVVKAAHQPYLEGGDFPK